jgi:hypothetical protein
MIMADISKCLEDLKSPSASTRFDACHALAQMKEIPESAMAALQEAVNDPDPLTAKEARKALEVHQQNAISDSIVPDGDQSKTPFGNPFFKFFFGGGTVVLLGFVVMYIFSWWKNGGNGSDIGTSMIGVMAFIIGQFLFAALVIYLILYGLISTIRSRKK